MSTFKPSKYQQAIYDFIANGNGNAVKYENVLFCAPSSRYSDRFDLTHYYYVNEDNKIDQDSYSA